MSGAPEFTAHQFMDLLTPLLLSPPVLLLLAVGDKPGVPTDLGRRDDRSAKIQKTEVQLERFPGWLGKIP